MNFQHSFEENKCSILTLDIRKHPQSSLKSFLKRQIEGQQWTIIRGCYVQKPMVKIWGAFFSSNFSNYRWFQTKQFTRLFRVHTKTLQQNPLEIYFLVSKFTKSCSPALTAQVKWNPHPDSQFLEKERCMFLFVLLNAYIMFRMPGWLIIWYFSILY